MVCLDVRSATSHASVDPDARAAIDPNDGGWIDAIYDEHAAAVTALASHLCGPHRAEDVTQEVFTHLWSHPERYDPGRGCVRTYLLMICHGKAIDCIRSDASRHARELARRDTDVPAPAIEDSLILRETAATIRSCLRQLPRQEREAIEAAYFGPRSYKDVARLLGEPEGTVKTRIRRGLLRLKVDVELEGTFELLV